MKILTVSTVILFVAWAVALYLTAAYLNWIYMAVMAELWLCWIAALIALSRFKGG